THTLSKLFPYTTLFRSLPLNGRNPVELIQIIGAAVPGGPNGTAGFPGGQFFSLGGGLLSGVTYFLDGALYNNPFDAVNLPFPFRSEEHTSELQSPYDLV